MLTQGAAMVPVAACRHCGSLTMLDEDRRGKVRCWRCNWRGMGGHEPCCDGTMIVVDDGRGTA
jgi:hypothetical protein